jgi:hypothetical protein
VDQGGSSKSGKVLIAVYFYSDRYPWVQLPRSCPRYATSISATEPSRETSEYFRKASNDSGLSHSARAFSKGSGISSHLGEMKHHYRSILHLIGWSFSLVRRANHFRDLPCPSFGRGNFTVSRAIGSIDHLATSMLVAAMNPESPERRGVRSLTECQSCSSVHSEPVTEGGWTLTRGFSVLVP